MLVILLVCMVRWVGDKKEEGDSLKLVYDSLWRKDYVKILSIK